MRTRPLWRTLIDALAFLCVLVLVLAALQKFGVLDIQQGTVTVIDGDSLREGQTEIRLYGIDAPEYRQTCLDEFRKNYPCGKRAAEELRRLVAKGDVKCRSLDVDRYGRAVSTCVVGDTDIAHAMVERGWAVAFIQYGSDYVPAEILAHKAKRGLWAGDFELPSDYRKRMHKLQSNVVGAETVEPD